MAQSGNGRGSLALGGTAALLASACCLGPLLLVTIGVGGAWIGNLAALAPYRPLFLGVALLALALAYRRIFRQACEPDATCAAPGARRRWFWIVAALVLLAFAFPYAMPLFY